MGFLTRQKKDSSAIATRSAATLNDLIAQSCAAIISNKHNPQNCKNICQQLAAFFTAKQITRVQILEALTATQGQYAADWERVFDDHSVIPAGAIAPNMPLAAAPPVLSLPPAAEDIYSMTSDIPVDLAGSKLSAVIVGASGTGKTTLTRALMGRMFLADDNTEFKIIDCQSLEWLGLQRSHSDHSIPDLDTSSNEDENGIIYKVPAVTFAAIGDDESMLILTEVIKSIWVEYSRRLLARQKASRSGQVQPEFHPCRLIVNEWNLVFDWAKEYKSAESVREFKALARKKGIKDPMQPMTCIAKIGQILSSGRDLNVSCLLTVQEIAEKAIGFSPQKLANSNIVAVGRVSGNKDGGYGSPLWMVGNKDRIQDGRLREALAKELDQFIKANKPVLVSTQGFGSICEFPDFSYLANQKITSRYRYYTGA
jgi:hypothetical protein